MFARIYRFAGAFARAAAFLGAALLVVAMTVTVVDVALRRSVNFAVAGTVDLTQLFVMAAVFLSIPFAFLSDSHVVIELATARLRPRPLAAVRALGALLSLLFMAAVLRYGWDQAVQQHGYGDKSQTIGVPILFYWVPLLGGAALAVLATALLAIRHAIHAAAGRDPAA